MKTRAAIMFEHNQPVVIDEIDVEPPKEGEVLVKMKAAGVCHSDLSVVTGTIYYDQPTVLGHEGAGEIVEVGPGVKSVEAGQRVMLAFISACGTCYQCTRGRPNICETHWLKYPRGTLFDGTTRFFQGSRRFLQMSRVGAMSDYVVVSENGVIPIQGDAPIDKAALIGCSVTTGVGAVVHTAKVEVGSDVAVIGIGGTGINVIQGAVMAGARRIIAVDVQPERLRWAEEFGATDVVNASDGKTVKQVRKLTDGDGVDYSFEAIGNPRTMAEAFGMLRFGGTAVIIGIAGKDDKVSLPAQLFPAGERRMVGSMYGSSRMRTDMPRLLDLYRVGRLKLDELVSQTYRLDQINEAFEELKAGRGRRGVILFDD